MADDLMDFTDVENKENSVVAVKDENDIPFAPGLVQSPVIVNSILKQSTKDNLIQLYTPVQKPEKGRLKVHFGHDSILETPTVKQAKKKMEDVVPIKEDVENSYQEDKDKTEVKAPDIHVADTGDQVVADNENKVVDNGSKEVAKESLSNVIEQLPIKDDKDSSCSTTDSGIEECAMEVSICEPTTTEKLDGGVDDFDFDDILLKSEMLLKSLRGELYTTDSPADESSQPGQTTNETSEKTEEVEEKNDNQTTEVASGPDTLPNQESNQSASVKEEIDAISSDVISHNELSNNAGIDVVKDNEEKTDVVKEIGKEAEIPASAGDEEPMDVEEAMEVDNEDDDEIVFNFGGNKNNAGSDVVDEEKPSTNVEKTNVTCEAVDNKTNENVDKDIESLKDIETEKQNVDKTDSNIEEKTEGSCVKEESEKLLAGKDNFDASENKNADQKVCDDKPEKTTVTLDDGETKNTQTSSDTGKTKQETENEPDSKKKGGDSSDEEFMSADEDMEVDEAKTPAKSSKPETQQDVQIKLETQNQQHVEIKPEQESPERIPPKVGYNLNFDDLDAMNPFSTKKALVNSPDIGKEAVKKTCENVTDVEKTESSEHFKTANSSPVKTSPLKVETPHSPNAAALVELLCKEKTAGDISEDDSKQSDGTETAMKGVISGSDTVDVGADLEMKKEIDFDNIDPFKPKTQIMNSPDITTLNKKAEIKEEDPFPASSQLMNTPVKAEVNDAVIDIKSDVDQQKKDEEKPSTDMQKEEEQKSEELPITPQKEIVEDKQPLTESPQIPLTKGAYDLDALDFDGLDPFKPAKQMVNSPIGSAGHQKPAEIDPFQPKKQILNSPVIDKKSDKASLDQVDTLKPETQTNHSSDSNNDVSVGSNKADNLTSQTVVQEKNEKGTEKLETLEDETDPFKTVFKVAISPKKDETTNDIEADPFESKSKIQNSPSKTSIQDSCISTDIDILDSVNPFEPRNQMQNSPVNKIIEQKLDLKNLDNVETISELPSSPAKEETKTNSEILDIELIDDPFITKSQIQNSHKLKDISNRLEKECKTEISDKEESETLKNETLDTIFDDPFKSKKKLEMSPGKSESMVDPFADLNPFQTKSKMVNTPEKSESENVTDVKVKSQIDPFKSSNKMCNSPALTTIEEVPFVTRSRGATTPTKEDDLFSEKFEIPTTPTNEPRQEDGVGDIFEVQGVTRRGDGGPQAAQFGDIDESQFVPASQIFNDSASWEMLEKLGGATTSESALSRMSLYVKFDPLVDEAPTNPRRISIRVSQLEKVKEYGLDETLLLLGTPPKKRLQSMSRNNTPSEQKSTLSTHSQPMVKKAAPVVAPLGTGVDLILDYSPGEKKQVEKSSNEEGPAIKLFNDEDSTEDSQNIFQELKYTEGDFKRFQRDNKLAMQGLLINKDQEFCKERKQWEAEKAELVKKCQNIKHDRIALEQAFLGLEQTVYELAGLKDSAEKKVQTLEAEKAQALEDIQAVETAFSDLHRRYEKAKTIINSMKTNEETLIKATENSLEKLKKVNEKLHDVEKSAEEKLAANKTEIEKLVQQQDNMQSKCDAQVKMLTIKISNLETAIQRKTEENKELTEICDNLLSKVDK